MTFEEFKQQFEIFSKTDTPEKLAICEKKYRAYLIQKEDADYFEPSDGTNDDGNWLGKYHKNLYSILGFDNIVDNQFHFLVQPSFEPEHLLTIERSDNGYTSTVVMLETNYWCSYSDNPFSTFTTRISSMQLDEAVGDQEFSLIEQSISQARRPQSGYMVLDGTVYKLSKIIGRTRKTVAKHSPEENSKTGRIVGLLIAIIDLTMGNSSSDIQVKTLITSISS